ncbi:hypothetical protein PILCRDRAFT_553158 [Piloderma croceum F 1598]|uniref:Uncharacterized protein n=1 Tax=Piloderma croceum (strain F 1598) TaxID=765440 RepID=A0A0C3BQX5_PILCF|nr:hypothetical protein PILCRDRAFT_553158 [Piloderma croceum F 1598]
MFHSVHLPYAVSICLNGSNFFCPVLCSCHSKINQSHHRVFIEMFCESNLIGFAENVPANVCLIELSSWMHVRLAADERYYRSKTPPSQQTF